MKRNKLYILLLAILGATVCMADNYVIINQVMYDTPLNEFNNKPNAGNGEYIELYNAGVNTIYLQGWVLSDGSPGEIYYFGAQDSIPSEGYLILACRKGKNNTFQLSDLYAQLANTNYAIKYQNKIILANRGETLTLCNAQNDTVDIMHYDGTSNAGNPNRLYAANPDSLANNGDLCKSLHRTWVEFDADGKSVQGTDQWIRDFVSFNSSMLPYASYYEHNIIGGQPLPSGENYVLAVTPLDPTSRIDFHDGRLSVSNGVRTRTEIQYMDGLGRPDERIALEITPDRSDLASVIDYRDTRRVARQWLPVVLDTEGQKISIAEIQSQAQADYDNSRPFAETYYENSARRRPFKQVRPGYLNTQGVAQTYDLNTANDNVRVYVAKPYSLYTDGSYYDASALHKNTSTDEDRISVTVYSDKQGRKIMEERGGNRTYYVYDELGRLRFILPNLSPSKLSNGNYNLRNATIKAMAYCYQYDTLGNMIYKRLPGCEAQYMVYDKEGQLVLKQDGNQRTADKWTMCAYDSLGRNVYIAEVKLTQTHEELKTHYADIWQVEHYGNNQQNEIEGSGYAASHLTYTELRLLSVNYYDNYDYLTKLPGQDRAALGFVQESGYGQKYDNTTGLLTGTRIYNLSENGYTATAYYYDMDGRVVQTRGTRNAGGYIYTSYAYLFDGSLAQTLTIQGPDNDLVLEHYRYTYDHAGRKKRVYYQLNNDTEITLSEFSYDSIGRLAQNLLHNNMDAIRYSYDMRDMLTEARNKHFSERLFYADSLSLLPQSVAPCRNGNIAAANISQLDSIYTFAYSYDPLNRLTSSVRMTDAGTSPSEQFSYDASGNIIFLTRYNGRQKIDSLVCRYKNDGHQLVTVTDEGNDDDTYEVIEYHTEDMLADTSMWYDANGNLVYDEDRGISVIHYNVLNLPDTVQFINGNQIVNLYDAAGRKYKSITYIVPETAIIPRYEIMQYGFDIDTVEYMITEYAGTIENHYSRIDTTRRIHNATGYYTNNAYYHYIKDHLGNICAVVHSTADTLIQGTIYYASGIPMAYSFGRDKQPYLYNGKEFVEAHGLNTYDYGFRGYYAPIGRFTTIDPLAEQTPWQSPYAYAGNHFVNAIDWMGLGGMTRFTNSLDICQYIVIDSNGGYLGGVDNDDWSIYIDPDGVWNPKDGIEGLERVGKMMFPFWFYEIWIGKGNKAPGLYYDNKYSVSISGSIGWQISADKFISLLLPSWELFDFGISFWNYSEGFEWGQFEYDYIGNDKEYKTTLGADVLLGYAYSIKHNISTDSPNWKSLTHTFSLGPIYWASNGTFGITLSIALIGGVSISITGDFYYEGD